MPLNHETILSHLFAARPRLCAAAYAVVRDPQVAEDIFQNVALKGVTKNVSFEHEGALLSWAMVCIKREGIDWVRKSRPELVGLEEEVLDLLHQEWLGDEGVGQTDRVIALKKCMEKLAPSSRALLELRYFERLNCQEVARKVGIGLDATYQRLSRLHRDLKKCIDHRLQEELS